MVPGARIDDEEEGESADPAVKGGWSGHVAHPLLSCGGTRGAGAGAGAAARQRQFDASWWYVAGRLVAVVVAALALAAAVASSKARRVQ